jgi:phenylalanyl-tRNA synthetase beta chain
MRQLTDFYDAKGIAEELLDYLGFTYRILPTVIVPAEFTVNSVTVEIITEDGVMTVGSVGEVSAAILEKYDIAKSVYLAVLDARILYSASMPFHRYSKISLYPGAERDVSFLVDSAISACALLEVVGSNAGEFFHNAAVFDVFSGDALGLHKKSIGVRMEFSSREKTLTEAEINAAVQNVITAVSQELGGILRG